MKPTPFLGKGGVAARINKTQRSRLSARRRGGSLKKLFVLESERTTPSAPFKGTGISLDGASTPLAKEGTSLRPPYTSQPLSLPLLDRPQR